MQIFENIFREALLDKFIANVGLADLVFLMQNLSFQESYFEVDVF